MQFFVPPNYLRNDSTDLHSRVFEPGSLLDWEEALIQGKETQNVLPTELVEGFSLWEFDRPCVVLGRGSKEEEANESNCKRDGVPVVRRCSGGATILAGPGCLMYSVVLSLQQRPELRSISAAHRFVMTKILSATQEIEARVELQGICDLCINGRKFSGNALRYKRDWLLYHGTILYDFPVEMLGHYLNDPARQPAYREGRSHEDFLTNIHADREQLSQLLCQHWDVRMP